MSTSLYRHANDVVTGSAYREGEISQMICSDSLTAVVSTAAITISRGLNGLEMI
jgi:hypothetical protein